MITDFASLSCPVSWWQQDDGNDVEILIEKDNKIYNIYQNNIKEDSIQ